MLVENHNSCAFSEVLLPAQALYVMRTSFFHVFFNRFGAMQLQCADTMFDPDLKLPWMTYHHCAICNWNAHFGEWRVMVVKNEDFFVFNFPNQFGLR